MRILFVLALIFFQAALQAQTPIKEYVQTNYQVLRSVDVNDTNYADLEAIGKAIGNRRVVMLGEQDHGDAPTFLAKTRIIKYLHEKMGFNVLAFESDFFAMTEGQREIGTDTASLRKYMQGSIFPIWTYCDACANLFYEYIPRQFLSSSPIIISGFDNQEYASFSRRQLIPFLDSAINIETFPHPNFVRLKQHVLNWTDSLMHNYGKKFGKKEQYDSADLYLQELLSVHNQSNDSNYLHLLLRSIRSFIKELGVYYNNVVAASEARDEQMAINLDWLANVKYRQEKIIVWAANGHVIKNLDRSGTQATTMGTHFCRKPGNEDQTYILGFTSGTGMAGRITMPGRQYKLSKPAKNSFETWFGNTPFTFIDFISYNRISPQPPFFKMKGLGHIWNGTMQWTKNYDGIIYIRDMFPCKSLR